MAKLMVLDIINGLMEQNTAVNGKKIELKDKVAMFGKMVANMMENGIIMK